MLNRLQKPILIPEEHTKSIPEPKPDESDPSHFVPHHRHIGIDRVLSLNDALSSVENMLQLATLQRSYRHGVERILIGFREQLGLEFAHLILCLNHPVLVIHEWNAVNMVQKLRNRVSKEKMVLNYEVSRQIKEYKIKIGKGPKKKPNHQTPT